MALKKINIGKLKVGMSISHPIYVEQKGKNVLLMADNTVIASDTQIRRLLDAGITSVEIDTDSGVDTFQGLLQHKKWDDLSKTVESSKYLVSRHLNTFLTSFTAVITKNPTSRLLIGENRVSLILRQILEKIQNNLDILLALIRLKSTNEYTYSHSINVTVMCISMANTLGFSFVDIIRIGTGTLLADVGMTNYPPSLIRRPSGLSKKEKEQIQKHPQYTLDFIKKNGINDSLIEKIINQHHERFDGSGYPNGLEGDEIHPISKLFAIADVYIAMISSRPHRSGIPPHMVLVDILKDSGTLYDPKITKLFIKHVGVFPVGNLVELTSGRVGIVAIPNKSNPLKPVIILLQTKKKLNIPLDNESEDTVDFTISRSGQGELVDLNKENGELGYIKRGLDHRKYGIKPDSFLDKI